MWLRVHKDDHGWPLRRAKAHLVGHNDHGHSLLEPAASLTLRTSPTSSGSSAEVGSSSRTTCRLDLAMARQSPKSAAAGRLIAVKDSSLSGRPRDPRASVTLPQSQALLPSVSYERSLSLLDIFKGCFIGKEIIMLEDKGRLLLISKSPFC